jgi:hypothetical protein
MEGGTSNEGMRKSVQELKEEEQIPGMKGGGRQFRRMEVGGRFFPGIIEFTRNGKQHEKVHMNRRKAEAVSRNERRKKRVWIEKKFPGV